MQARRQIGARHIAWMRGAFRGSQARRGKADLTIERDGPQVERLRTIRTEKGVEVIKDLKNHPAIAVSNAAWRQVRAFCSEFGLSPAARTRLIVKPVDTGADDELAALLATPRKPREVPIQ